MTDTERRELTAAELDLVGGGVTFQIFQDVECVHGYVVTPSLTTAFAGDGLGAAHSS